jgi:hypothetical protein
MLRMNVRERVEVLRQEIAEIQQAERAYLQLLRRDWMAMSTHDVSKDLKKSWGSWIPGVSE